MTCGGETRDMGHLASGDEGEAGASRNAEQLLKPRAGDLFGERRSWAAGVDAGVLVPGGSEPIGGERGGNGAADYPGVETSAGAAHDAAGGIGDEIGDDLLRQARHRRSRDAPCARAGFRAARWARRARRRDSLGAPARNAARIRAGRGRPKLNWRAPLLYCKGSMQFRDTDFRT